MLTDKQQSQLNKLGISNERLNEQLENFVKGFPYLKILSAATIGNGIHLLDELEINNYLSIAENYKGDICKFVPASGAASRMFKDLFEAHSALKNGESLSPSSKANKFLDNITKFPFFGPEQLLSFVLFKEGLNYGSLPKGLLLFHKYQDECRTPFQEHLVEGALYAKAHDGSVNMVVTVSPEHLEPFKAHFNSVKERYQERFNCKYNVLFTTQSPSTDVVAVDMDNNPFVLESGELLFRPGGHGALLQNLNEIDANIIVLKNIDNVVKEELLEETIKWKKTLIGVTILLQEKIFSLLNKLDNADDSPSADKQNVELYNEIIEFLKSKFSIAIPEGLSGKELKLFLYNKLNRPVRVCGMVKNEGEPGGGPYIILNSDKSTSLQILEGAQIDSSNVDALKAMKGATHFNPVDIVCGVKNYKGEKFNLLDYTDPSTGFISTKSYKGRELKAQELPGLWNGAMSNWNTMFIETPLITFNPVKTVIDLLKKEHL